MTMGLMMRKGRWVSIEPTHSDELEGLRLRLRTKPTV